MVAISSILINIFIVVGIGRFLRSKFNFSFKSWEKFLKLIIYFGAIWLLTTAVGYLITVPFIDHAESNIASVAAYWLKGNSIYTEINAVERYSLLYGPWPYLMSALFQSFGGATLFLAKIPGVLNLLVTLFLFYSLLVKGGMAARQSLLGCGVLSLILLGFYNISYWGRPDSYLMMSLFLSFYIVEVFGTTRRPIVYLSLPLLAGFAVGCKLHGVIYFLPVYIYFLEFKARKLEITSVLFMSLLFGVTVLVPFFIRGVDGRIFLDWMAAASKHGLLMRELVNNLTFIASFWLVLGILEFHKKHKWTSISILFSTAIVAIVASKPGAGTHHFMPFAPILVFFGLQSYSNLSEHKRKSVHLWLSAFILSIGLHALNRQKSVTKYFKGASKNWQEFLDLQKISQSNSGIIELGYGSTSVYPSTLYKSWLVDQGHGLLFDGASLMDAGASGIEIPDLTYSKLSHCEIATFVFPKNSEPWSMVNFYGDVPLFPEKLKILFRETYVKKESSAFFDIYRCAK